MLLGPGYVLVLRGIVLCWTEWCWRPCDGTVCDAQQHAPASSLFSVACSVPAVPEMSVDVLLSFSRSRALPTTLGPFEEDMLADA
jgi:hypothetical protein